MKENSIQLLVNSDQKNLHKKQGGFTLLELLVVIGIIGILISMIVVAFSTAQVSSRDARRRSDMKAMQDAFEQYYSDTGATGSIRFSYDTCDAMTTDDYFPNGSRPVDPKNSGSYVYTCNGSVSNYCVCALLEKTGSGNSGTNCAYAAGGDYYCLSSLQ